MEALNIKYNYSRITQGKGERRNVGGRNENIGGNKSKRKKNSCFPQRDINK